MYTWETYEDMVAELLKEGCITDVRYEEDGPVVTFNMEVLELKYPEVADAAKEEQMEQIEESLNNLVDMGLLQMGFADSEDGGIEAVYSLTEAGEKYVKSLNLTDQP